MGILWNAKRKKMPLHAIAVMIRAQEKVCAVNA